MDPINPVAGNPEALNPKHDFPKAKKDNNQTVTIASVAVFILLAVCAIVFLYNQNQNLKKKLADYQIATPQASV